MSKLYIGILLLFSLSIQAQLPAGYYDSALGKTESGLKTQLFNIIGVHTERTYTNLWSDFLLTDKRADGKVWDMYSTCNFTFGTNQDAGSGGNAECQYYNREHSFPKSWFKDGTPMYSDLFHLYPTDKFVNAERGNFPYGETLNPTNTYSNGSKKGLSTYSGYSGTVFEPINEYKGDFARTYFYMVTAYQNRIAKDNWISDHLPSDSISKIYPSFTTWSISLFLKWNKIDPISTKEINRNNAVFGIQNNRNPFIDYPELAEYIWGTKKGTPWSLSTDIEELHIEFSIYPNPAQQFINIKCNNNEVIYTIYNLNGQIMMENPLESSKTIHVAQLEKGMYLLQLSSGTKKSIQKIIINK